ncbi:MAG: hypothetical protein D8M57_08455 [Candidatus Scalindua sp. AMX11]|nr:MAG: hypothetical protein DWQ00_05305 [Candidatus Scalindua sp.]NOG84371.1 hypothetical protein [Planctomycetota bacterium]RZV74452.1 MAG: hypothetical protein EX341_13185 [Candidatus Scalindua sp. SCAELEC01]TDE65374.1 MAG: hypothetical protein D8M57_08455 [Candidatus Scalindua sp. AMX11]GJQ60323.1 MAG: hypothetical protein SCALA701_31240 [Candidatus Scalindua sp.]
MNISIIKKNKFWFVTIGIVALLSFLYGFFANPYRLKNTKQVESLERLLSELERYEKKGLKIINPEWIKAEEEKLERTKEEKQKTIDLFAKRDRSLEKIFGSEDEEEITDVALWKSRYIESTSNLLDTMARSNLPVTKGRLSFKEWGDEIPTWESIEREQKRFWVVEELLNIIRKKELKISSIESIHFTESDTSPAGTGTKLYDIVPCSIKVSMDIEQILAFIHELLNSKLCFEIDTVNIDGKLNNIRIMGDTQQVQKSMPYNRVHVVIETHAIDFKT